jgi:hypothetical protein
MVRSCLTTVEQTAAFGLRNVTAASHHSDQIVTPWRHALSRSGMTLGLQSNGHPA